MFSNLSQVWLCNKVSVNLFKFYFPVSTRLFLIEFLSVLLSCLQCECHISSEPLLVPVAPFIASRELLICGGRPLFIAAILGFLVAVAVEQCPL